MPPPDAVPPPRSWLARHGDLLFLLALTVPIAYIRLRIADVPLGRDEGEYAYAGQLLLHGVPPYVLAYNMKFPGTYYAYAAMMAVIGETPWAIRVGLLIVNVATALVLLMFSRRMVDRFTATVSASAFLVLSLDRWVQGTFAHATHFALLPALAGLTMLLHALDPETRRVRGLLGAGALLAISVLMKQHAALFIPFGLWLIWRRHATDWHAMFRAAGWLTVGGVVPAVLMCLLFAAQGVFGRFVFWTFGYATSYVTMVPLSDGWKTLTQGWEDITRATLPLWLFAAAGVVALWVTPWPRNVRLVLTAFGVASFLAVCPGLYFRAHYFILMLPTAALFTGVAVTSLAHLLSGVMSSRRSRLSAVAVFAAVISVYFVGESRYLFTIDGSALSREVYGANPFVEAPAIASYIREHTAPDDSIAVLGSEPEIYFLADRRSATGYIYTYPLMEPQPYASRMQDEMMTEVETAHPKYVVATLVSTSWLSRPSSDHRILNWAQRYTNDCYDEVGVADIQAFGTTMRWEAEASGYKPQSEYLVYTFRRKSDAPCTVPRQ